MTATERRPDRVAGDARVASDVRPVHEQDRDRDHHHDHNSERRGLRYWPIDRTAWWHAAIVWLAVTVVLTLVGLLIVHGLEDGAFGSGDRRISEWFRDQRTPAREDIAQITSGLSDSLAVIPITAVLIGVFAWRWRRWHEGLLLAGALLYEKAIFLPVTMIVGRERPPVGQLDGNPPSSSFFSGHVAAAVAFYFALYLIVRWHSRSRAVRGTAAVLATLAVLAVATSRLLLGMHYMSDVLVGAGVGVIALLVVRNGILGTEARRGSRELTRAS